MDLTELRNFRAVADHGNFTKAAAQLHIAQSALSRRIRKLEESFGVDLLRRTTKGVVLTPAGAMLYEKARRWEQEVEATRREVGGMTSKVAGTLRIAVQHWVSTHVMPHVATFYREHYPDVFLSIVDTFSGNITEGLLDERFDVAIMEAPTHEHNDITSFPLWCENLRLFGPASAADTPLFRQPFASMSDIAELPFITASSDHAIRRIIDAAFMRSHVELKPVMEANGASTIFAMVKAGLGYTLMPSNAAQRLLLRGEVAAMDVKPQIRRTTSIVTRTALLQERTVVPFINLMKASAPQFITDQSYGPVAFYLEGKVPDAPDRRVRRPQLKVVG